MNVAITRRILDILQVKTKGKILTNPHFWVITIITLVLIFIYRAWPWREWQLTYGVWEWFPWLSSLNPLVFVELPNRIVGSLFMIPIIYAAVVFSWQGALIACLLSFVGVMPIISMWSINAIITNIILLLLPLFIVSIISFEITWRRKERRLVAEREAERQLYVSKILESQENERRHIAQELHDGTIQTLLVIANQAQNLAQSDGNGIFEVKKNAERIKDMTLQAVEELRRTSLDLRPSILDDLGLIPALRWLLDRTNTESDVNARIRVNGVKHELSHQAEIAIFRIVQEALNNIKRHSKATDAVVTLELATDCFRIMIEDNGQGFHVPKKFEGFAARGKLGLIGMQQRIQFLHGALQIRSKSGEGTLLIIEAGY